MSQPSPEVRKRHPQYIVWMLEQLERLKERRRRGKEKRS